MADESTPAPGASASGLETHDRWLDARLTVRGALGFLAAGAVVLIVYALSLTSSPSRFWATLGVSALLAGAAFLLGALIGFLFGIPRSLQRESPLVAAGASTAAAVDTSPRNTYGSNTNLEQISDWLTKIIVGIGLVELKGIPGRVAQLLEYLHSHLPPGVPLTNTPILTALVYFGADGFLAGYLLTRFWLPAAFKRTDLSDLGNQARAEQTDQPITSKEVRAAVPSGGADKDKASGPAPGPAVRRLVDKAASVAPSQLPASAAEALGTEYFQRREYARAIPFLNRAVELKPNAVELEVMRAMAIGETGNRQEAARILERLRGRPDAPPEVSKLLGYFLLWLPERLEDAVRVTSEYLQRQRDDSGAIFNLACAHAQLHGRSAAIGNQEAADAHRTAALDALRRVIALDARWKQRAREVPDFLSLSTDEEFRALTGGSGGG